MALISISVSAPQQQKSDAFKDTLQPFTKKHCVSCHNNKSAADNVNFEKYKDLKSAKTDKKVWMKALSEVMKGHMPPPGLPAPKKDEKTKFEKAVKSLAK